MPTRSAFTGGVANGNSISVPLDLPSIEGQAVVISSISVLRGGGRLVSAADSSMAGLSHQTDVLTATLLDDQDDFVTEDGDRDYWWVHGLSEKDHATDHLAIPKEVAGPQSFVWFNKTGATNGARIIVTYELKRIATHLWVALKRRTSYEGVV